MPEPRTIYTVGHSTRSLEELASLLHTHGVGAIADVRLIPRSRRHPHFAAEALAAELPARGIEYHPFRELGGRRRPAPGATENAGWRTEAFRGYADFMQTPAFAAGLARLEALAAGRPTAIMCAEAVPWRCHRQLIADALVVRGWLVLDVTGEAHAKAHALPDFARVDPRSGKLTYPGDSQLEMF